MSVATLPPQIVMTGDAARTPLNAPLTSHLAADLSSRNLAVSMRHVLELVQGFGPLVGSELNHHYREQFDKTDWVSWDSPRKRAGELAERGLLAKRPPRVGRGGTAETEYELTLAGLEALELAR